MNYMDFKKIKIKINIKILNYKYVSMIVKNNKLMCKKNYLFISNVIRIIILNIFKKVYIDN